VGIQRVSFRNVFKSGHETTRQQALLSHRRLVSGNISNAESTRERGCGFTVPSERPQGSSQGTERGNKAK